MSGCVSRPILFSGEMVRAILDGRKTQTRRVLRPQPVGLSLKGVFGRRAVFFEPGSGTETHTPICRDWRCPYGQPGDRLWVRETWREDSPDDPEGAVYRADAPIDVPGFKWKPSIFMPRWASRLTLEITGVRVEQLQEISGEDCLAEGVDRAQMAEMTYITMPMFMRDRYRKLWDSLNAKRGFGWDVNPWVWVLEFQRIQA